MSNQQQIKINTTKETLLLVGAEYSFDTYIAEELKNRNISTKFLNANLYPKSKYELLCSTPTKNSVDSNYCLKSYLADVKTVISCIEGSTMYDLCTCYRNNIRLIQEISNLKAVEKIVFVFTNVCNLHKNTHVLAEKNRLLFELKKSEINYTIVKHHGLFSNFIGFLNMAQKGKVYLSGDLNKKFNPIHLKDLAIACIDTIEAKSNEVCVGGPEILNLKKIAKTAINVTEKSSKIIYIPRIIEKVLPLKKHLFKFKNNISPINFCIDIMIQDCISIKYGTNSLEDYFMEEAKMFQPEK